MCILEQAAKYKQLHVINLGIELAEKLGRVVEVVRIFEGGSELFYRHFWDVQERNEDS